ncbi:muconate/chloromuconate family cycloisomerase [Erwinia persicina]|uniref:Muconate cycloisomerase n=1 Tax=Erwinia persicina TaxID=55211 RepID=A0ABR8ZXK6_9GAMM|nr:muconate/chloromuconate family cycloisomerase [Erwinia persicina]MBD8107962.1 muconate cycloisomerase [Erwinia persicina]MBD8211042.1 muconate cycloisomerase [Erwinia persicina]
MIIDTVETLLLDVPAIRPHRLSMTTMKVQTLVLVRIACEDGVEGWGEATTIGGLSYGEESPDSIKANIDGWLAPLLIGQDASRIAPLMARLAKAVKGNRFAKCALETALMDAQARRLNIPLSELLGGRMHDALPVAWTLASGDTGKDIAEAQKMLDLRRHRIFKLKIGRRNVSTDVAHVLAVRRALGDQACLRVDVNQAWDEREAEQGMAALEAGGIAAVEQPVRAENHAGLARLSRRFSIPIIADEALNGPQTALTLASQAAADVFSVKISQSGGLTAARQVADIARLHDIALYGGTMLEGAPGTAASAHLFSTFSEMKFGTELFGPLLLTADILTTPLVWRDFMLQVPTGPGLGIAIDTDKVAALRRR